jgi:uncharacterized membrane protein
MDMEIRRRDSLDEPDGPVVSALVPPPSSSDSSTFETARVLAYFFLYSMAMFSLPFIAYVGTKYGLKHFGVEGFANTAWSVVAAVVVVNTIILMYACKGYHEDVESTEQDKQQQCKTDHNLKAD